MFAQTVGPALLTSGLKVVLNTETASQLDGKRGQIVELNVNGFVSVQVEGYCAPILFRPTELEAA